MLVSRSEAKGDHSMHPRAKAGLTGLEPATSYVTGRHSNQLSYSPAQIRLPVIPRRPALSYPSPRRSAAVSAL
jgi:hypothetical protein